MVLPVSVSPSAHPGLCLSPAPCGGERPPVAAAPSVCHAPAYGLFCVVIDLLITALAFGLLRVTIPTAADFFPTPMQVSLAWSPTSMRVSPAWPPSPMPASSVWPPSTMPASPAWLGLPTPIPASHDWSPTPMPVSPAWLPSPLPAFPT